MSENLEIISVYENEEYFYERMTPSYFPQFIELFKDAFNTTLNLEEVRRRFNTQPLGCEHIAFIAIHKETKKPAAYYGVFPHKAVTNNEIFIVAQSGDTMTHSEHRKKGLFVSLARITYAACIKNNIQFIYGFPNENSHHGLINRLNWKQIDNINRYDLKLSLKTFPLSKLSNRFSSIKKLQLQYAKWFLRKKINNQVSSFQNNYPTNYTKVLRDKNFIVYKQTADNFFLNIENVIVWVKLTDVIWIGDFDNYDAVTPFVIMSLKKIAFWLGYNTIVFHLNESIQLPNQLTAFKKNGQDASCYYVPKSHSAPSNFIITGVDFDTW